MIPKVQFPENSQFRKILTKISCRLILLIINPEKIILLAEYK